MAEGGETDAVVAVEGERWATIPAYRSAPAGVMDLAGDVVADVYGKNATGRANIIAAAPDLLEALEWAMHYIGTEPRLIRGQNDDHFDKWHTARAAVAKARGHAPNDRERQP